MSNITITDLGDAHLGKNFITGVPLHRRGDRETMVWNQFVDSIENCDTDYHIQTGDLFNQFAIPEALLLDVANHYRMAAEVNPDTTYVLYRGNHDASRDTDKASSFDVLAELLINVPNIHVLREPTVIRTFEGFALGFIPWHPFKSADELALELINQLDGGTQSLTFHTVYGHFDVESFGGSEFNLVPTKVLAPYTKLIKTGHIHLPTEFVRDGVTVKVVGSMSPYAHGEDPEDRLYQTINYVDLLAELEANPSQFHDVNVRVIVKPGEVVPEINCLALTTKPFVEKVEAEEEETLEVKYEDFNMHTLFATCMAEKNVRPTIAGVITAKFEELKNV